LAAARAKSFRLRQTECEEGSTDPECAESKPEATNSSAYYEDLLLGIIDGTTGSFNGDCRGGLAETVRSTFSVLDNIDIYDPRKLSKFSLSNVGLTEATNVVYAYCDVSHLVSQFVNLADYENYE